MKFFGTLGLETSTVQKEQFLRYLGTDTNWSDLL